MSSPFRNGMVTLLLWAGFPAGPPGVLRVCADPDNLPFSNRERRGFENRIAELVAHDLHTRVHYAWRSQRRGFVRKTLDADACDLVMGAAADMNALLRTAPYYRSTYVFVSVRNRALTVRSLDDPLLKRLRVGVQVIGDDGVGTPPAIALAKRGIIRNVQSYPVPDDAAPNGSVPRIISAVANGAVDIAAVWGPLAGYWARRAAVPLTLTRIDPPLDLPFLPFAFDIAVGVRRVDAALRARVDSVLARRRAAIDRILDEYGVPVP